MLVSKYLENDRVDELVSKHEKTMKIHLIKHDVAEAEACVREMQGYWLGQREPISSTSVNKCRACEYNSVCSKSLFSSSKKAVSN
jgi:CRISPR/Cas system-associated exonuclease Cas4 (RecB family)